MDQPTRRRSDVDTRRWLPRGRGRGKVEDENLNVFSLDVEDKAI
jgi:hypothetical protein